MKFHHENTFIMKFLSSLWPADEVMPGKVIKVIKMMREIKKVEICRFGDSIIVSLW